MSEPVRVLHYIGSLEFGGSQAFVMELYRKIDKEKVQFDFVTFLKEKGEFYNEILKLGGKIYECPRYNGRNHFEFIKWWKHFFAEHSEYKVLHGHVRSVASLYIPIAKKAGVYTIIHSHSTSNGHGLEGKIKDIMQFPIRWQANALFACSSEAGKWMYGKSVTKRKNYRIIPNAIDTERFVYDECKRKEIRDALKINERFVIGVVGRLSKPKNHQFLIDIFAEAYKKNSKIALLLVGDGELRGKIEQQIQQLGIEEATILVGGKSNTQDYYQIMDVFALPSLWEGFGIAAIEAQCNGLQCMLSEQIPTSVDMKVGLIEVLPLEKREDWIKSILKRAEQKSSYKNEEKLRISQSEAVKKAGYDVTENARKLQRFYIRVNNQQIL